MTLSKDQKQKLKKLRAAKYNSVKGIDATLFTLTNEDLAASEPIVIQYKITPLPPTRLQDCMGMFEENMGALYRESSWGLDLTEKREELDHLNARFLLVYKDEELVGYCHFRFETNDDDNPTAVVVYVYELQVSSKYQRYGIGQRLMDVVHQVTLKAGLTKIMLTVFNANEAAVRFYKKLGYVIDGISPSQDGEESDYEIMSHILTGNNL